MIITLKGDNFSANNIGTLSTWTILRVLGDGATYSGSTYVDKGTALNATVTIADGYELGSAGVTVTMGGNPVTSGVTTSGSTITINIASVTGNVVIKVPTVIVGGGNGGSGSVNIVIPPSASIPTTGTLTSINFNTSLSNDEIDEIIKLNELPCTPIMDDIPAYPILMGINEAAGFQVALCIENYNAYCENAGMTLTEEVNLYTIKIYAFVEENIEQLEIYNSQDIATFFGGTSGWNQENIDMMNGLLTEIGGLTLMQVAGVEIGTHNEDIVEVVNRGDSSDSATILKTLEGEYEAVNISVKENSIVDLTTYMDNQQMPISVNVYVPETPYTLKALLDKTMSAISLFEEGNPYGGFDSTEELEGLVPYETTENVTNFDSCFRGQYRITRQPNLNYNLMTSGEHMFENCTSLKEAVLNYPVLSYANYMFDGCSSLTKVNIYSHAPLYVSHMFDGCSKLTTLIIRLNYVWGFSETPEMMFSETPIESGTGYIYVPDELVETYKTNGFWSTYANQIKPLSEYVES